MRMTVTVQSGTLSYSGSTPAGSGSGTVRLVLVGTLAQLNSAYAINYLSPPGAFGSQTISVVVNDGDPAAPGPQTGSATGTISINAPPVIDLNGNQTGSGFTAAYTEQGTAVAIVGPSGGNGLTVTDADSTNMLSATVQIVGPLDVGGETLSATQSGGITVSYNPASGRLVLTGSATKAAYQSVLRTVKYASASNDPSASRTINFQVFDNAATPLGSNVAVATVNVTAVNDAPVLDLNGAGAGTSFAGAYTENAGPLPIAAATVITDVDNSNMLSATVQIANFAAGDILAAVSSGNVTVGAYNAATGRLALAGSDAKSVYETVLRSVTYSNTSDNPSTTARTINFRIFDGATPPLGRMWLWLQSA